MAQTTGAMENAWKVFEATMDDTEFVDLVQSTTGEYYRLTLAGGILRHWNRTTGTWDTAAAPASLVSVTPRIL